MKSFKTILILTTFFSFVFGMSACGYKDAPYYQAEALQPDENVKFIMQKKEFSNENNTSCNSK